LFGAGNLLSEQKTTHLINRVSLREDSIPEEIKRIVKVNSLDRQQVNTHVTERLESSNAQIIKLRAFNWASPSTFQNFAEK